MCNRTATRLYTLTDVTLSGHVINANCNLNGVCSCMSFIPQGQALNTLANESLDASRSDTLSIAQIIEGTGTINPSPIFVRSWLTYIKSLGDTALADKIERFLHHHEQNYVPSAYVPFAEDPAAVVDDTEGLPSSPTQAEPSIPVLPSAILVPDPSVSCHSQSGAHTPQQQPLYSLPQAASPTDADMADADMAALPPALSGEDMPQQPPHTTLTVCTPVAPVAVVAAGRPLSGLGMGPATTNPQVGVDNLLEFPTHTCNFLVCHALLGEMSMPQACTIMLS